MPSPRRRLIALCAVLMLALCALAVHLAARRFGEPEEPPPPMVDAPRVETWKDMARKVEEPRGEPVGRAAKVTVPSELRHYTDRKRFLAIQVAATREQDLDMPHDYADLVRLIERDQLVEIRPFGEEYLLYGVAGLADGDPFTHYDPKSGMEIPLYDGWGDFRDAHDEMTARLETLRAEVAAQRGQLRKMPRQTRVQRRRRVTLQSRINGGAAAVRMLEQRRKVLASFYEDYDRRRMVVGEHALLVDTARAFEGRSYDLQDPAHRVRFKARLLSFLRPEARDVMLEIAQGYREQFDRPLPVSSLVRTLGYQRRLTRANRSATAIDEPPHASGLAFDVYTGRMAAAEQQAVMQAIAALERAHRVEALREPNDHVHVFVLPDGRRPAESLIALSKRDLAGAPRPRVAPPPARRPAASRPAA
ncbi:MAG TPA: DUF5715 family protein, partial [Vicinamibacteria bacterium]|nr:DUF5715 family protein [Vicinamibacteria bacterium]